MELRHLRYFVAAAEEENVSRAAGKLHVSQPGVSRQIRDLEEELGFELFHRTPKSLKLTEAGKVFLKEARAVLQRAEDAVKSARAVAAGAEEELHVGYAPSLTARFLPQTLRAFQAVMPKVRVKLHDAATEEMLAGLREGKLQLALMVCVARADFRGFQFAELTRDSLCLAVGPNHPLAAKRTITLEEAAREPLISYSQNDYPDAHKMVMGLFTNLKVKPRIAEECDSVSSLIAAIEAGNGVAIVTRSLECTSGPRLKLIPFSPAPEPLTVGAAWMNNGLTTAAKEFLSCARQAASEFHGKTPEH
jgi:DNA-binding transcriptional LysR family regulator